MLRILWGSSLKSTLMDGLGQGEQALFTISAIINILDR